MQGISIGMGRMTRLMVMGLLVGPGVARAQDGTDAHFSLNLHVSQADFSGLCDTGGIEDLDCNNLSHDPIVGPAFIHVVASKACWQRPR